MVVHDADNRPGRIQALAIEEDTIYAAGNIVGETDDGSVHGTGVGSVARILD